MARENQGLQITLIVFVFLTIVLGVASFLFYRNYQEQTIKVASLTEEKSTLDATTRELQNENMQLKEWIGDARTDKLDVVSQNVKRDMDTYAANFPAADRNYRKVLQNLQSALNDKNATLDDALVQVQNLKTYAQTLDQAKQGQIDQYKEAADKAAQDLLATRTQADNDLQTANQGKDQLMRQRDTLVNEARKRLAEKDKVIANKDENLQSLSEDLRQKIDLVNQMYNPVFEQATGEITHVDQRSGTVWINLGSADGLRRQTSFAVYAAGTNDVQKAAEKGSIEVTRILKEHLAEARIVDDKISDPILRGDLIHTPVWVPGSQERFAITDGIDLDRDGKPDPQVLKNLISMNGGVIDAELTQEGKRVGQITGKTRYLIIGREQDENTPRELLEARSQMINDADKLGVERINLDVFLRRMGWKNETPVVHYGKGGNLEEFRPRAPEGGSRVSAGNVSSLYQPEEPSRGARRTRTAY